MEKKAIERCRRQVFRTLVRAGMEGKKISGHEITPALCAAMCDHLEDLLRLLREKDEEQGYRGAAYRRLDVGIVPILLDLMAK